jgi:hypothetical protein
VEMGLDMVAVTGTLLLRVKLQKTQTHFISFLKHSIYR